MFCRVFTRDPGAICYRYLSRCDVELVLEHLRCWNVLLFATECGNDLHWAAKPTKLLEVENVGVVQVYEVRRRIFVEKRFKDLTGDAGILIEHALFLDTIGPLTARQGPLVVSNMADEVKIAHLFLASLAPQLI